MSEFQSIPNVGGSDGFECGHCRGWAVCPDANGFVDTERDHCEECGFPGDFYDGEWHTLDVGTCDRDDCPMCGTYAGEHYG